MVKNASNFQLHRGAVALLCWWIQILLHRLCDLLEVAFTLLEHP